MSILTTLPGAMVQEYMSDAVEITSRQFTPVLARSDPDVVAQLVVACAITGVGMDLARCLNDLTAAVRDVHRAVADLRLS